MQQYSSAALPKLAVQVTFVLLALHYMATTHVDLMLRLPYVQIAVACVALAALVSVADGVLKASVGYAVSLSVQLGVCVAVIAAVCVMCMIVWGPKAQSDSLLLWLSAKSDAASVVLSKLIDRVL